MTFTDFDTDKMYTRFFSVYFTLPLLDRSTDGMVSICTSMPMIVYLNCPSCQKTVLSWCAVFLCTKRERYCFNWVYVKKDYETITLSMKLSFLFFTQWKQLLVAMNPQRMIAWLTAVTLKIQWMWLWDGKHWFVFLKLRGRNDLKESCTRGLTR